MGRGASNTQEGAISDVTFAHKEDHDLLVHQVRQLADIRESLEPLNLRHCTEDSLNCLVSQLQEVVKAIWPMPSHVIEAHMMPKKALLQDLRSALIELLLAQDQLATKGRTSRFYKHLLVCQEYLGRAFDINLDNACSPPGIEHTSLPTLPQKAFFAHTRKYYTDFLTAQSVLERVKLSSVSEEGDSIEQFDCVNEALNVLYTLVQEFSAFSHKPPHFQEETFRAAYQFCINISYLEEQIPRLLELIKAFHSAYYSSPQRAKKISREIVYNLEAIVHSSREVPPTLIALLKLPHSQRENVYHLRLVYSSES